MSGLFYGLSLTLIQASKFALVYAVLLILLFLSMIDISLFQSGEIRQGFLLIGLYFWTVYRPHLLPYPVVFLIGILMDLMSGGLLGLHAFCFMVLSIIIRGQRRFLLGQSWQMVWAGFFVAVTITQSFQALAYAITSPNLPSLWPLVTNIFLAALFYPVLHPVFMAYNRFLNEP
ncbi:MAG TPA: rod shape-determining protein MreD [Alphaproteobacteria bacterium]|jgi:rod shape-determining protein MreD|nr:rod shape-determining protein MreD [Alphaproteobacteria bacterium]HRK97123.1 rod shape-determining protein MreD [Alphaproteobacteria bacterium]